jgi:prevent-host-death family protein
MNVGVRELKARLSDYLDRAERGEIITVTERGRPKAVLAPLLGRGRLQQGIDEGWIRPATRRGLDPVKRQRAERQVLDALDEDRSE